VSSTAQSKVGYLAIGTSNAPTIPLNVSGTANMTTLSIGGTAVTATGAQLNYVAGVTSAIQTQLNAKEPTISAGTTAQYWRGDKTWQVPAGGTLSCTTVTASATNAGVTATCATGYVVTGGGCYTLQNTTNDGDYTEYNYPSGNGWYCARIMVTGLNALNVTAYAQCCKIQ